MDSYGVNYLKGYMDDEHPLKELMDMEMEKRKQPIPLNREQRRALRKSKGGEKNGREILRH